MPLRLFELGVTLPLLCHRPKKAEDIAPVRIELSGFMLGPVVLEGSHWPFR